MENARKLAVRWFEEVWNLQNSSVVPELATEQMVSHNLEGPEVVTRGRAAFLEFHALLCGAIPDLHFEILDTVAESGKVALRLRFCGTHTGDHLGIKPTNNRIDFLAAVVLRLEDGRIAESWNYFDQLALYQQLNVLDIR